MTQKRYNEIPKRQKCVNKEEPYIGGAVDIIDDAKGKTQQQINKEADDTFALHQSEINALDSQNYESYTAASGQTLAQILPATGAVDTIYRVGNWDGTQYDTTKYAEYAWNGSEYKLMDVKEVGIDEKPTPGSHKLVESGGVKSVSDMLTKYTLDILLDKFEAMQVSNTIPHAYIQAINNVINYSAAETRTIQVYRLNKGYYYKIYGTNAGASVRMWNIYKDSSLTQLIRVGTAQPDFHTADYIIVDEDCYIAVCSFDESGNQSMFVDSYSAFDFSDIYNNVQSLNDDMLSVLNKKKYVLKNISVSNSYNLGETFPVNSKLLICVTGVTGIGEIYLYNNAVGNSQKVEVNKFDGSTKSYYGVVTVDLSFGVNVLRVACTTLTIENIMVYDVTKGSALAYAISNVSSMSEYALPFFSMNPNINLANYKHIEEFTTIAKAYINLYGQIQTGAADSRTIQVYSLNQGVYRIEGTCGGASVVAYGFYADANLTNLVELGPKTADFVSPYYFTLTKNIYLAVSSFSEDETKRQSMFADYGYLTNAEENSANKLLKDKEIFSIFDSLGSLGVWQAKLSSISGMAFDVALNNILSIGGRYILDSSYSDKCGFASVKYLVDNYRDRANKGIIFLENVHDWMYGNISDAPYFVEEEYKLPTLYVDSAAALAAIENAITNGTYTAKVNSCITAEYGTSAKVLSITTLPSAGTFYIVEYEDSVEKRRYGISVNSEDTLNSILAQIAAYEYLNYSASVVNNTVVFTKITSVNSTIGVDANSTGIVVSITNSGSTNKKAMFFLSKDLTDWTDLQNAWNDGSTMSLYSKLKGEIEYLQKNLPNAKIYFVMPSYSIIRPASDNPGYYYDDGSFNVSAWKSLVYGQDYAIGNKSYQDLIALTKEVGKLYGVETIDIMNEGQISPINWLSYYDYGNSHPVIKNGEYPAYNLWAEFIYRKIK